MLLKVKSFSTNCCYSKLSICSTPWQTIRTNWYQEGSDAWKSGCFHSLSLLLSYVVCRSMMVVTLMMYFECVTDEIRTPEVIKQINVSLLRGTAGSTSNLCPSLLIPPFWCVALHHCILAFHQVDVLLTSLCLPCSGCPYHGYHTCMRPA